MKSLSQLQDFFYEKIYPDLKYLEQKRMETFSFLRTLGILLILVTIFILVSLRDMAINMDFFMIILGAPIGIFVLIYKWKVKEFSSLYKDQIVGKIVEFVSPSLLYLKQEHISKFEYDSSALFPTYIDRYQGDDLIKGKVDGVDIKFSEIKTEKKKKTSKNQTYYQTIFHGLFFIAEFNKKFKSKTIVLPDMSEKILGSFAHVFQNFSSHGELVKLDNPNFEKEFVVYSSDQIEARYILSHSLMKSILELKSKMKKNISISFNGSKIYIAVSINKNIFEPKVYKKVTDFNEIKEYFQIISMTTGIVNTLNLDIKIWSKE